MTDQTVAVESHPYRPWWPVWMGAALAGLAVAVAVVFTLITTVQRAEEAENRAAATTAREVSALQALECRAQFNTEITAREQRADNAEHALLTEIVRAILTPAEDRDVDALLASADGVDRLNAQTTEAIAALQLYVTTGPPLPCPFDQLEEA